jgi:hypothetical protein
MIPQAATHDLLHFAFVEINTGTEPTIHFELSSTCLSHDSWEFRPPLTLPRRQSLGASLEAAGFICGFNRPLTRQKPGAPSATGNTWKNFIGGN